MPCIIKNVPPNFIVAPGNRGIGFPYNVCELPLPEICYLAVDDNGTELNQENGDQIRLRCIE
jgi:hypothetical protein